MVEINRRTPIENLPTWLTVEELRQALGLGKSTAYELVRSGQIPSKRFGRKYFVSREVLRGSDVR